MTDILLAKPNLPPGFIDTSVGEAQIVREKLFEVFDMSAYDLKQIDRIYDYPFSAGYKPLVKLLEDKYNAPVIITNGAKQALAASFYAIKQEGYDRIAMKRPYWALIPPLAAIHQLESKFGEPMENMEYPYLLLSPNNPDGDFQSTQQLKDYAAAYKDAKIPFIHDAAYYTRTYLPDDYQLASFGDIQIYSISKMLGLSGIRIGFVVCHNPVYYKLILQYMEAMTVGVSMISQIFLYDLLHRMHGYPTLNQAFESRSSIALEEAKRIVQQIDPSILEVPSIPSGMFLWAKVLKPEAFLKAKINIADGKHFGMPDYIRMNIAFNKDKIQEIVNRLNAIKEML